jgi:2-polyprenyl-3-methyl-5-hydroxy-6-metoxy-1,4-benzoquinol methylase
VSGTAISADTRAHALLSGLESEDAVYLMVKCVIEAHPVTGGVLVDIGAGKGRMWSYVRHLFSRYIAIDAVQSETLSPDMEFLAVDLNSGHIPLADRSADAVLAVETIEHLENPRALMREMARVARPGALVIVTTPNQLSLLSLMNLIVKKQFLAFQEAPGLYPAHIAALLEIDLVHIATECGLHDAIITYSNSGRIPKTNLHWPSFLRGRWFSDNLMLWARK